MTTETIDFTAPVRDTPPLSWAADRDSRFERVVGCAIENLFGRRKHVPIYQDWARDIAATDPHAHIKFMEMVGKPLIVASGQLPSKTTCDGPTIVVANHPFGLWDGFTMISILERMQRPFFCLAHEGYSTGLPTMKPVTLPISWDNKTRRGGDMNMRTHDTALDVLRQGGVIGVFPAGVVSTAPHGIGRATEAPWQSLAPRLVMASNATVLPIFIEGQMGRAAQICKAVNPTLGDLSQLIEFYQSFQKPVRVHLGAPIPFQDLAYRTDRIALADELRDRTLALGRGL